MISLVLLTPVPETVYVSIEPYVSTVLTVIVRSFVLATPPRVAPDITNEFVALYNPNPRSYNDTVVVLYDPALVLRNLKLAVLNCVD
jgi:hypothetical protein